MDKQSDRKLLSAQEVCAELEISRKTLSRWVKAGKFPEPVLNDDGRLYWDASAVPPAAARDEVSKAEPKPVKDEVFPPMEPGAESIGGGL